MPNNWVLVSIDVHNFCHDLPFE